MWCIQGQYTKYVACIAPMEEAAQQNYIYIFKYKIKIILHAE